MDLSRVAMLLALPAVAVPALEAVDWPEYVGAVDTLACYVAMANDLAPLIDPGAPDVAAASAECVGRPSAREVRSTATAPSSDTRTRRADVSAPFQPSP